MSEEEQLPLAPAAATLLFQAPQFVEPAPKERSSEPAPAGDSDDSGRGRKRTQKAARPAEAVEESAPVAAETPKKKNNGKKKPKKSEPEEVAPNPESEESEEDSEGSHRRRRRRSRSTNETAEETSEPSDQVQALKGSTRLEAKRMRRREGRREGRRRQSITEAEFLARRESVDREMVVRHKDGLDQIAVLEDGLLVEHYVARRTQQSIVGNIYLGRVQNVLPSMEAAFVDIGRGRNAVLYAGEVNWDALGMEGKPRRIEQALKSGDTVLVQVTKDPIGHKGARLTSQVTLAGRYLVLVPGSSMLGISRKLPDTERSRLKKILREAVPNDAGVIVRTAAEGASEEQLRADVDRLVKQWSDIQQKQAGTRKAPQLLRGEPELVVRVVRDIFNEDFKQLVVQGDETWATVSEYVAELSPELEARLEHWTSPDDVFQAKRIDQQLAKGMDRKVWLPSGGTLVIDRTEALTVVDVNTGKFIGSGGTLEETVTRNNLEAAEEIVRQLRLRDIGGIIIIDFVDMVLESNRELVLRRLVECLGRDRTRHQVTEITSLGLVQMTRKRVGEGLVEAFSTTCEACEGRGFIVHDHPVEVQISAPSNGKKRKSRGDDAPKRNQRESAPKEAEAPVSHVGDEKVKTALSAIAAATVVREEEKPASAESDRAQAGSRRKPATRKAPAKRAEPKAQEQAKVEEPKVEPVAAPQPEPEAKPKRRRVVSSQEPIEPTVRPAADAGEGRSLLESAAAALDAVVDHRETPARPRRRRKVVAESPIPAVKSESRPVDEAKREAAQQAVQDLLGS